MPDSVHLPDESRFIRGGAVVVDRDRVMAISNAAGGPAEIVFTDGTRLHIDRDSATALVDQLGPSSSATS